MKLKLPSFLRLCFPERKVNPTGSAEPGDLLPDKHKQPLVPGIKFYYKNRDHTKETGGIFESYVPKDHCEEWLAQITHEVMSRLGYLSGRPDVHVPPRREIRFFVEDQDGVAWTERDPTGHIIYTHISSHFLRDVLNSRNGPIILKREIPGVLTHELAHAFQWDAMSTAPGCIIEGIADWVRVKNNYAPVGWTVPRPSPPGTHWTEGSSTWFMIYLDEQYPQFVERLNQMMATRKFDEEFFYWITGKDVDVLFEEYQAWLKEHQPSNKPVR